MHLASVVKLSLGPMISELWLWYIERILYGEGLVCEYRPVQQRENESTSSRGFQAASIVPSFSCSRPGTQGTSTRRHTVNASNSGWPAAKRNMCMTVRSSRRCVAASHQGKHVEKDLFLQLFRTGSTLCPSSVHGAP